jgi:hypothetical protein
VDAVKLTEDRARRLSRLIWRDRLRHLLPLMVAALAIVGALAFMLEWRLSRTDRTVAVQAHDARCSM